MGWSDHGRAAAGAGKEGIEGGSALNGEVRRIFLVFGSPSTAPTRMAKSSAPAPVSLPIAVNEPSTAGLSPPLLLLAKLLGRAVAGDLAGEQPPRRGRGAGHLRAVLWLGVLLLLVVLALRWAGLGS